MGCRWGREERKGGDWDDGLGVIVKGDKRWRVKIEGHSQWVEGI